MEAEPWHLQLGALAAGFVAALVLSLLGMPDYVARGSIFISIPGYVVLAMRKSRASIPPDWPRWDTYPRRFRHRSKSEPRP